jgi:hypothetical protein
MSIDDILLFLGKVVSIGGGAAIIAYGIFKWLGKKWLENFFSKSLEAFKHQQDLQVEQYRFEINRLFNRITKIHEKEFEILPTAWNKLQEALGRVASFTSPLQSYPDLNHYSEVMVEETLVKTDFSESQKEQIRFAEDKNQLFIKTIFWYELNKSRSAVTEFHNYLALNKIFLSQDLFGSFSIVDKLLTNALQERELMEKSGDFTIQSKDLITLREELFTTLDIIESQIQKRLHYTEAE